MPIYCPPVDGLCASPVSDCETCTQSYQHKKFKDHYKPVPKRIPVELAAEDHTHAVNVHIAVKLYDTIKQKFPDGIKVP